MSCSWEDGRVCRVVGRMGAHVVTVPPLSVSSVANNFFIYLPATGMEGLLQWRRVCACILGT